MKRASRYRRPDAKYEDNKSSSITFREVFRNAKRLMQDIEDVTKDATMNKVNTPVTQSVVPTTPGTSATGMWVGIGQAPARATLGNSNDTPLFTATAIIGLVGTAEQVHRTSLEEMLVTMLTTPVAKHIDKIKLTNADVVMPVTAYYDDESRKFSFEIESPRYITSDYKINNSKSNRIWSIPSEIIRRIVKTPMENMEYKHYAFINFPELIFRMPKELSSEKFFSWNIGFLISRRTFENVDAKTSIEDMMQIMNPPSTEEIFDDTSK